MAYTALAIDLDGTLLVGNTLPDAEREVIFRAKALGLKIIIATARWLDLAVQVTGPLNLTSPIIVCSGAQVFDPTTGEDLVDHRLPSEIVSSIYQIVDNEDCIATATFDSETHLAGLPEPKVKNNIPQIRWISSFSESRAGRPRMITVQGKQAVTSMKTVLADRNDQLLLLDSVGPSGNLVLTITAANANKGLALRAACAHLGIDPGQVIAFGDTDGDLDMFAVAGRSVAMGQASRKVQNAATDTTAANTESGVAQFLNALFDNQTS
jgi:hypothetical protein